MIGLLPSLFFTFSLLSIAKVDAHGYVYSPRSMNFAAHEAGTEYCHHCLNSKAVDEVCGRSDTHNYDNYDLPWQSEVTWSEGDIVEIGTYLATPHNGHQELKACPDGENPSQECFDSHTLEFVEDLLHAAPPDPDYPERGYLKYTANHFMRFKLPPGVYGNKVKIQWMYITANSCNPPGYRNYDFPSPDWFKPNMEDCDYPYPADGSRILGSPEQFWNCIEVTIIQSGPTSSPVPTSLVSVPTNSPVTVLPSQGCCSQDFKECVSWCGDTKESCETCGQDLFWLKDGAQIMCQAKWDQCTASDDCCNGLSCIGDQYYSQCIYDPLVLTPTTPPQTLTTPHPGPLNTLHPSLPVPTSPVSVPTNSPVTVFPSQGCCSQDFKECVSWCGETKDICETCGQDLFWLKDGAQIMCQAKWDQCTASDDCCSGLSCIGDQYYSQCLYDPLVLTPTNPPQTLTTPHPSPLHTSHSSQLPGDSCCTLDFKNCGVTLEGWCSDSEENCIGACNKWWLPNGAISGCIERDSVCSSSDECCGPAECLSGMCTYDGPNTPYSSPTTLDNPTTESPPPTSTQIPSTAKNPTLGTTYLPTKSPSVDTSTGFSCNSEYTKSGWDILQDMIPITHEVSANPYTLSILAEGGASGSGGSVVSEGQAYGILTSAFALASMEKNDKNRIGAMIYFEGYFNGWKKMCQNSLAYSYCQSIKYCGGEESYPCLPGWKHDGDLTQVQGSGAAPDGDEDAIAGMIIAIKATKDDIEKPSWYEEVRTWADASCTQFLQDNTVLSSTQNHRLLKLGTCWGGWDNNGNNPSYPSPGAFRLMRDFQESFGPRDYTLPNFGDELSLTETWNMLIDTTYTFLETTQCPDTGLVPNWALVTEADSKTLEKYPGSFSGSGTPQKEFGAEASRTLWRVAFDAILYPDEASGQAGSFLKPIHDKLANYFNGEGWDFETLSTSSNCLYVDSVFSSWQYNGFIYAPLYSTLAVDASGVTENNQQSMVNTACLIVADIPSSESYYSRSWRVIAGMTLNGNVDKVGSLIRGEVTV